MFSLRLWIATTIVWLFVIFNIERFHEPINLASFVYVLVGLTAAVSVVLGRVATVTLSWQCLGLVGTFVAMKWAFGYPLFGPALPLTTTEVSVLIITLLLVDRVSRAASDFEASVNDLTLHQFVDGMDSAAADFSQLYREVRRARQHDRPFGIVTVSTCDVDSVAYSRILQEIQRNSLRQFVNAKLGKVISECIGDLELVARHGQNFVVAVPEATPHQLHDVAKRLNSVIGCQLGWQAKIGTALFPSEEVTLAGLLSRAEREMTVANADMADVMSENNGTVFVPSEDHLGVAVIAGEEGLC